MGLPSLMLILALRCNNLKSAQPGGKKKFIAGKKKKKKEREKKTKSYMVAALSEAGIAVLPNARFRSLAGGNLGR